MRNVAIIGSTGSIGTQTLEIARDNRDINICALSAGSNIDLLEKQTREFKPELICIGTYELAEELKLRLKDVDVRITYGMDGLIEVACIESSDILVTAIVGMIGIKPTVAAINAGKDIALANKETLVTAGHIIMSLAKEKHVSILPVDSEHSAIFQALQGNTHGDIAKIHLTASGGPFRGRTREELKHVTVGDALKHPNWSMGKSVIHSMVQFKDCAVIAQLGTADMRLPIQYALFYPERRYLRGDRLDFSKLSEIKLEKPDMDTFLGLKYAYEAIKTGGLMPTVLNAANEKAVALFLQEKIQFLDIYTLIRESMDNCVNMENPQLGDIFDMEQWVYNFIESRCR